ncbi:MAG: TIR domain-containing protein [Methylococcaceae bacterium]|nr:TIR domain-containing protein [Methylococcaceae bacterium]
MSEEALERIAENILKRSTHLDLSRCSLTVLPPELLECVWLTELDISGNWDLDDLSPLAALSNLQTLDCGITSISDLSPLATLGNLQTLKCVGTNISDLSPLAALSNLQTLNCSSTTISDLSPLAALNNLQKLECWNTTISDLSPLAALSNLQTLNCSQTSTSDLSPLVALSNLQTLRCNSTAINDISPLAALSNLQTLNCSDTTISDLSPLAALSNLQTLECWYTNISDLSPLAALSNLQTLYCRHTNISDLSPLAALSNLQIFDCSDTNITDLRPLRRLIQQGIPVKWETDFSDDPSIFVEDCPLICPPPEIARDSPEAVRDYFDELSTDGQPLNEVKVLFLGEASAGKTSLVKRLRGLALDPKESQTHGIRICPVPFTMDDGGQVLAHCWDFGGQEVMHATHQFFLSERSIYVLLLNARNDDQAEKWLKHAESFGGLSPVLVVLNKIDENPSFQLECKTLQAKYPQIVGFYRLSCAIGYEPELQAFTSALRTAIVSSATRRTPFPSTWLAVKNHFVEMTEDYIDTSAYQTIAARYGVTKPLSQTVLLQFLHDLGVVINFRHLACFDTHILNPLWLTNGVYRVINSTVLAEQLGVLNEADLTAIINDSRYQEPADARQFVYPPNKLLYIVRVMQEFELRFMLKPQTYCVPQLLRAEPTAAIPDDWALQFVCDFRQFLPSSVFPRLMVKLHDYIDGPHYWRSGMLLAKPLVFAARALVRWDKEERKIWVSVSGEERRRFLSFIRATLREIVGDFAKLAYEELVPIPECDGFEDYDYLVTAEQAGEQEVFIKALKKRVKIADLLDGVEEPSRRNADLQLPVNAFVSYAHADLEHLKTLHKALAPLIRLESLTLWDDRCIDAGSEWLPEIKLQLQQADVVLCLVSPDFVGSDFCYLEEFTVALAAHQRQEQVVVPICLRATDWDGLPLAAIQGFPTEWIMSAADKDAAWVQVSRALRPVLDKVRARKVLEKNKG